jgi:thiamine kinase-like enzyme
MRIPCEGTGQLINRKEEYEVYQTIKDLNLCDDLVYMNPDNGYKITKFIENGRNCDATSADDIKKCMKVLRGFHNLNLQVDHSFDLKEKIEFYESLWQGKESCYRDYTETKRNVYKLLDFVEANAHEKCLCHIDSVCDNFMIYQDAEGREQIRLIDWEYAGMQDPNLDIATFAIYAMFDREQIDALIDSYYVEGCEEKTRYLIYAYIAIAGLTWSNWCEYKRHLGVEFGEYSLRQYRYAKEYFRILENEMGGLD